MRTRWEGRIVAGMMSLWATLVFAQPEHFSTSLHATRAGKSHWYGSAHHGFESLTHVPIQDLGCVQCHAGADADGVAYGQTYRPGCSDCHPSSHSAPVQESTCYGCHGRQSLEANALDVSDVHRQAGMVCWDCHTSADLHGDGTQYASMLEKGAVHVDCEQCHPADKLPPEHAGYDPHGGKLHCTACHAQTAVSCYNCHFESMTEAHVKRAKQPISDFVLLLNRTRDGKVVPGSFQSLTYQGKTFVAFAPYASHTITRQGRKCHDCHANFGGRNAAIEAYNRSGRIPFAQLADDGNLTWMHGVVPLPEDYRTSFQLDFLTFDGAVSAPAGGNGANWSSLGKERADGQQMLFASPLTRTQMDHLGFGQPGPTAVAEQAGTAAPGPFALARSYPNPFNGTVTIPYRITRAGRVRLEVFSENGQRVATLIDRVEVPGSYRVHWNGTDDRGAPVASGAYLLELRMGTGARFQSERVVLLK